MLHEPAPKTPGQDKALGFKSRLGMRLFCVYTVVYAGFVAVSILSPEALERRGILGLNLAVTYGFGLIVLAILLGLVYNHLCTRMEDRLNGPAASAKAGGKAS